MNLMLQIFDVVANENAHYKRNELEFDFNKYFVISNITKCPPFFHFGL